MINKKITALCILLSTSLNAQALDFSVFQGDGQCPSGYTLATPQQARDNKTSACGVLGTWYIARLAGGGSMDGPGYNCKIRDSDTRKLGHSLCVKTYRVAVVQLNSSNAGNFVVMGQLAKEAKEKGAELVIFPEASVFGWLNPEVFTKAAPIPGEFSSKFATIAKEANIWVATGLAERGPKAGPNPDVYEAYDSGILVNPKGEIIIHHRKYSVLKNAFDPKACQELFGTDGCNYTAGPLSDVKTVQTPYGRTAILVCADAYTYDPIVLDTLKAYNPQLVIVPWGVAAGQLEECGTPGFNATGFASDAAKVLNTAYVVGANAVGKRPYGRFLPSWYCGTSGFVTPSGEVGGVADTTQSMAIFDIPLPDK